MKLVLRSREMRLSEYWRSVNIHLSVYVLGVRYGVR